MGVLVSLKSRFLFLFISHISAFYAGVIGESELLLLNRLYAERKDELVSLSLRELGVEEAVLRKARGVSVYDSYGKEVPAQLDILGETELTLSVSVAPFERKLLKVRVLDEEGERESPFQIEIKGTSAAVSTPYFPASLSFAEGNPSSQV